MERLNDDFVLAMCIPLKNILQSSFVCFFNINCVYVFLNAFKLSLKMAVIFIYTMLVKAIN